jgi:eukaryotic-like serine/threonine-protein kinase
MLIAGVVCVPRAGDRYRTNRLRGKPTFSNNSDLKRPTDPVSAGKICGLKSNTCKHVLKEKATSAAAHPPENDLLAFAQGLLGPPRAAAVEVHIAGCDRCAAHVAGAADDGFISLVKEAGNSKLGDRPTEAFAKEKVAGFDPLPPELRDHPRYKIERLLASGAMGDVYLARDKADGGRVVVKVLMLRWAGVPKRKKRFLQEARVAERLRHANIARVLHSAPAGESAYIVAEFVAGETLAAIVARRGPLPVEEACGLVRQAAAGLAYAARQRAVHRDIKPENLMLDDQTKQLKIVDFGLGRLVDEQRSGSRLTRQGDVIGTANYIAPEQISDSRSADARADIYGLACVFYFLLTGAPPFRGAGTLEVLRKHQQEPPPAVESARSGVPPHVSALVDRMLEKDPNQRPRPEEIVAALATGKEARPTPRATIVPTLLSPAVLLPVLTLLGCLWWLLNR